MRHLLSRRKPLNRVLTAIGALFALALSWPDVALASGGSGGDRIDLTHSMVGYLAILIFVVSYGFVMAEEFTHLRKSKPVLLAAGVIWVMIAVVYANHGLPHAAEVAARHNILEYSELFLFLLVAMTYINAMEERDVFQALRSWLIPAAIMHFAVPLGRPEADTTVIPIKRGGKRIIFLFLGTIATAVSFHNFLHLPPMMGMMLGLSYLMIFAFYVKKSYGNVEGKAEPRLSKYQHEVDSGGGRVDVFPLVGRAEWDTLLFFYGVILAVGGLGFIGYLAMVSQTMYVEWGPTTANILVGFLSAIVDNIPVMFAVLTMGPDMSLGQWLLVTLTAGVGGSMLSIGSAAGVALMGQARGRYTFFSHFKWSWAIALGYGASISHHSL